MNLPTAALPAQQCLGPRTEDFINDRITVYVTLEDILTVQFLRPG